jgi:hypothetical protein
MDQKQVPVDVRAAKPTLMGQPALAPLTDDGESTARILSDVKLAPLSNAKDKAGRKSSSSTFRILGALSLAAVAAFFGYQYISGTTNESIFAIETKSSQFKATKNQNPIIEELATPAHSAVTPPQEAAQIVNDSDAAKTTPPASSQKLTAALEDGVKPPKTTIQRALESKPEGKSQAPQKALATVGTIEKKPSAVAGKDKDINLLAAIITHNTNPPAPAEAKQVAVAKSSSTSAAQPGSETTSFDAGLAVAKPSAQSTEAQLKKCNAFGFFDRELCRIKTCSNLWETNAACKATLSPNPVATAEAQKAAAQKLSPPATPTSEKFTAAQSTTNAKAAEVQLKQCAELSFFEREVCRVKTCNNQWETNAACKATLSPDPVATAEASKR